MTGILYRALRLLRAVLLLACGLFLVRLLCRLLGQSDRPPPEVREGLNPNREASVPPRGTIGGVHVKLIRRSASAATHSPTQQPKSSPASSVYLFYEKSTGTAHFHVEAGPAGELPIDHAAGLLAMHCMVRGQSPEDYLVMVPAPPESLGDLAEKAQ